ncbi:hypothetical protein ACPFP2_08050 [Micromonospora citrea]|uniref:hypothetical protein n=1 Tax=Micromonospora citrea TaxID=47855 RepID=UPI003C5177A1
MPAQPSSGPRRATSAPGLAQWARQVLRDRPPYQVLHEMDYLLLADDDGLRQRVFDAGDRGLAALDKAVVAQNLDPLGAARAALSRAASIVESVGVDRLTALADARDAALRVLDRRKVLAAEPAAVAARSTPGTAALSYAVGEVERSGARHAAHRARSPRDRQPPTPAVRPDPKAVDPGGALGVLLAAVPVVLAVTVFVGTTPAAAATWGSTSALLAAALVLVVSGGRSVRGQPPGRLSSTHLIGVAVLGGVGAVASSAVALSDPFTGRYVGAVFSCQAMSTLVIVALAVQVRRAEHRSR